MLLRRITLIRNRGGQREVRGLFLTYGGILIALSCVVMLAGIIAGVSAVVGHVRTESARRALERERQLRLAIQERHGTLVQRLADASTPSASTRGGALSRVETLRAEAAERLLSGDYERALEAAAAVLTEGGADSDARREAHLRRTLCLAALARTGEARVAVDEGLAEFSDCTPLLQLKADVLLAERDFASAGPIVERLSIANCGASALFSRANLRWAQGRAAEAAEDFNTVLSCGRALLEKAAAGNLALLLAETGAPRVDAFFYLSMLERLAPGGWRTERTAGRVHLLLGDSDEAERRLLRSYALNPRDAETLLDLALLYEQGGRAGLAREYVEEAVAIEAQAPRRYERLRGAWILTLDLDAPPRLAAQTGPTAGTDAPRRSSGETEGLLRRAHSFVQAGRAAEARPLVQEALHIAPRDSKVLLFAATFANACGDLPAAEALYLRALDTEGGRTAAVRGLAATCLLTSRFERALYWAAEGLAEAPGDALFLRIAAESHFAVRRWGEALDFAKRFLAAGGAEGSHIHYVMATGLKAVGDAGRAAQHYVRALELDETNVAALNDYASLLCREGRAAEALGLCERLLVLSGREPFALDTAGLVHYRTGDLSKARSLFDEALAAKGDHPEVLVHSALVYKALGDDATGARLYKKALAAAGGNAELLRLIEDEYRGG